jgi:hypothetical protein
MPHSGESENPEKPTDGKVEETPPPAAVPVTGHQFFVNLGDPEVTKGIVEAITGLGLRPEITQIILNIISTWVQTQPRLIGPRPRTVAGGGIPISPDDLMMPFLQGIMKMEAFEQASQPRKSSPQKSSRKRKLDA